MSAGATQRAERILNIDTHKLGLIAGPLGFCLVLVLPLPADLPPEGVRVLALTVWMATWWLTEAIPIAATALLPLAVLPTLQVLDMGKVASNYGNHLIFLFMGGFFIAVTMERWGLHRRIALHTVRWVGTSPSRIVLGFMLASAFLSMWMSNTATCMMMVTIGMALIARLGRDGENSGFGTALMLGIAYASSIGGVATLIGTPPNAIFAGIAEKSLGITIGFADWMLFALPLAVAMLAFAWCYLTCFAYRRSMRSTDATAISLETELRSLGPMSPQERRVAAVFVTVAIMWLAQSLVEIASLADIRDSTIAILGALCLFVIPANWQRREFLLDWPTAAKIPWDVIILFGGGFALADAFMSSGLTHWVGQHLEHLKGIHPTLLLLAVTLAVVFLTEVTSNTATASLLVPVAAALASALDMPPLPLMAAVTLAASFAFMLPVATPPNAIIFSSRRVSIPDMARAGLWLNLVGALAIVGLVSFASPT